MIITIGGLPCTGTTTLANELSNKYNFKVINAGHIFREMAKENGMDVIEFGRYMAEHPELDKQIDKRMVEYAYTEDNIILEGRLIKWYLLKETIPTNLSIWLKSTTSLDSLIILTSPLRTGAFPNLTLPSISKDLSPITSASFPKHSITFRTSCQNLSLLGLPLLSRISSPCSSR
jgi:hypothetical protein